MPSRRAKSAARRLGEIARLGREGASRREIAAALHLTLAELAAHAAEDAALARTLALAEEAARAWWEGVARAGLAAGVRINPASWRGAMESRFGDAAPTAPAAEPRPIFDIPDNGTDRRRIPDLWSPRDLEDAEHMFDLWALCRERAHRGFAKARAAFVALGGDPAEIEANHEDFEDDFDADGEGDDDECE